jgi:thiosulfate dehydrogenase (quinone) large subunit
MTVLALVRGALGAIWYHETLWKLPWNNYGCRPTFELKGGGLCDWVGREIANPPFGLYHSFLVNLIGPNIRLVGFGVWLAETTVAALLFLGLLTRLGGLLGTLQALNLLIGLWNVPGEWHSAYVMLVSLNLIFLAVPAGRFLGADQFLLPRLAPAAERGSPIARLLVRLM